MANFYTSVDHIIKEAYLQAGLVQEGDDPNSEQLARAVYMFNDLVAFFGTQGLKLFTLVDTAVTLTAGKGSYTIGPSGDVVQTKPLSVFEAYYLDSSNNKRPLVGLSWDEFTRLSQTTQQGAINSYFVDKQVSQLKVTFWLIPDATAATGTAHLILRNPITTISAVTDTFTLPIEWNLALIWGMADLLCTGQPAEIMKRCREMSTGYRMALESWDVEDVETRFVPDPRSAYGSRTR